MMTQSFHNIIHNTKKQKNDNASPTFETFEQLEYNKINQSREKYHEPIFCETGALGSI